LLKPANLTLSGLKFFVNQLNPDDIIPVEIELIYTVIKLSAENNIMGKFVINRAANGELSFNLKADNLQILLTSQMYSSRPTCFNDIESVRTNCSDDSRYERKKTVDNKHYFVLMGPNGEIIGKSELFSSLARMENGIKSVKKNGTNRKVVEEEPYF